MKKRPFDVGNQIQMCKANLREHLRRSVWERVGKKGSTISVSGRKRLLGRYTTGVAAEFQAWLGFTHAQVKNEYAKSVLLSNLVCEFEENHIGMLYEFVGQVNALPIPDDRQRLEVVSRKMRVLFEDRTWAGLAGLTALTVLESTSPIFIPILARTAKSLGADNFEYTDCHGSADVKHSRECEKALGHEMATGGDDPVAVVVDASSITMHFLYQIFEDAI
ncbi:MAG: iron-containing redox enzyme family protein [Patescibacteria group bacterium]